MSAHHRPAPLRAEDVRPSTPPGVELLPPPPPRHRSKGARADWYPVARTEHRRAP